jgi:8-oxo-dGTP diphosphatase
MEVLPSMFFRRSEPMNTRLSANDGKARAQYVLGFMIRGDGSSVVLIRKNKPQWQAGLLNGVGGKIEPGETPHAAMIREFREETGVDTSGCEWRQYCELAGGDFEVYCFAARDTRAWEAATSVEAERIIKARPDELSRMACVSNLHWLIALALDENGGRPFDVCVRYPGAEGLRPIESVGRHGSSCVADQSDVECARAIFGRIMEHADQQGGSTSHLQALLDGEEIEGGVADEIAMWRPASRVISGGNMLIRAMIVGTFCFTSAAVISAMVVRFLLS